jgi:hypothetical protein
LIGGSNITCDAVNFSSDTNIISINDTAGCITGQCIKSTDCTSLISVNYPNAVIFQKLDHDGCNQLVTVNAPLVETIGPTCFRNCLVLKTFYVPSCINLGGSTGDDSVFDLITGQSITVTINSIIATCNGSGPDGDIVALLTANPSSTIIYV